MNNNTNKPTDPIDSKNKVEQSNDPKIDQDVPGYPHKPSTKEELKEKDPTPKAHETEVVDKDGSEEGHVK